MDNDWELNYPHQQSLTEKKNDFSMSCKYKNNGRLCDKL
jgi:hypothetical protein